MRRRNAWRSRVSRSPRFGRLVDRLFHFEVLGRLFASIGDDLKVDVLAFVQRAQAGALNSRDVHEHIFAAARRLNEAITLRRVEPLNRSASHAAPPVCEKSS